MEDIIQIKCPFDGAVLSVKNQPGIESKYVTCPVCNHKYPFTQFKRVALSGPADEPGTEYPHEEEKTSYDSGDVPEMPAREAENFTLGLLRLAGSEVTFRLKPGRNVIGRKATKSTADFQIDTADNRSMSREHIVVEVKKVPGSGFVHYVYLFKEKVNDTFIGAEPLLFGDCLILNHGDIIKLPDATLTFEIPDDEATEI